MLADPVLHLLAGPNGSGKSTLAERVLIPQLGLRFVNADVLAAERWPGGGPEHSYEAAQLAAAERADLIVNRRSFITETVFSHPSKVQLLRDAAVTGYLSTLHVVVVPVELTVARVAHRVSRGGHPVPEDKVRERYARLWTHVREAMAIADETYVYDNSDAARPYRVLAVYRFGQPVLETGWPAWSPREFT